ncbi:dehydrodolichyl diphosphate synthase CPT3-like [Wolffia australiana]
MEILSGIFGFIRRCLFSALTFGPMPTHVAFIMDGNRRFSQNRKMGSGAGHRAGFTALMSALQYCYEMGVSYVTVYAFSIDNFKRKPEEVDSVMNLMLEKIESGLKKDSLLTKYKVKVNFWGNLRMLTEPVRLAMEKAMAVTAGNTGPILSVCVAYSSSDEIVHAVEESCRGRVRAVKEGRSIQPTLTVKDLERSLFSAGCPDPDIIIRTSGETRLSNFLLWQTPLTHLQNPSVMWPAFSLRHMVWSILEYQRAQVFLEKRKRSSTC